MSADLIERLRAGLEGVTDGPWEVASEGTYPADEGGKVLGHQGANRWGHPVRYYVAQFVRGPNAAHIALCSPENIRALLDALAAKDTALSEMRADLARAREALAIAKAKTHKCVGCGANDLEECPRARDTPCWRTFHGGTRAARALASQDEGEER